MKTLENESLKLRLNVRGEIDSILDKAQGRELLAKPGLWRIIFQKGPCLENELLPKDIPLKEVSALDGGLRIVHESPSFKIEMLLRLSGNQALFDAKLENRSDTVIREFQFPAFGLGDLKGHSLIWSRYCGERLPDVGKATQACHTGYMAEEQKAIQLYAMYPGFAALNCFMLDSGGGGLYFGSHDKSFQNSLHLIRKCPDGIAASFVKYPFLGKGQSASFEGFVFAPYSGSWREGAKIYRQWASSWYKAPDVPDWIKGMNGWQRVILRHQYGETFFKYSDLERILDDGKPAGIDTIFMFGWTRFGHDNAYPHYLPDEGQGGFQALKGNIAKVKAKGGKVIVYFNGRLIDRDTQFYRETGHRISLKSPSGADYVDFYQFGGPGTSLRVFGNRAFSIACPYCREWFETLKSFVDCAIEMGADGVFFDQLGFVEQPCFDPSHGHKVPCMDTVAQKAELSRRIREYVKSRKPDMAFGGEWVSDMLTQHVDFIHSILAGGLDARNPGWEGRGERPETTMFLELFRYIFPNVVMSDREIRDDSCGVERRVNQMLLLGLSSDVEIYRCRADIAETPRYREYLGKANKVKTELSEFIQKGVFLDAEPFNLSNPEIDAKAFQSGDRIAVLLTQSHLPSATATISVEGCRLERTGGLGDFKADSKKNGSVSLKLSKNAFAALIFKKVS